MQKKEPSLMDYVLGSIFAAIVGAGLALIFIYRTGWGV